MLPDRRTVLPRSAHVAILSLTFVLATTTGAFAQGRGEVEVDVADAAGKGLADVAITVKDATGAVRAEGTTNKKGKYKVTLEGPAASYDFVFEKAGLGTETMAVKVEPGMISAVTMTMQDEAIKNKQLAVESFNEGVGMLQSGNETGALEKFVAASELDPQLAEAQRLIAILAANTGDIDTASAALDQFLELAPENAQAAAPAAYIIYRAQGRTDALPPVRESLRALGIARDFASNVYNEGVAAVRAEDKEKAIALFQEAIAVDPTLPAAYQSIAALYFNDQEYDQALPYLDKLAGVAPENFEGQRMAFYSHLMLGDEAKAKQAGKQWLSTMPAAKGDLLKKGEEIFDSGKSGEAQTIAEVLVESDPSYGPGHYLLGRVLAGAGKVAEAKQHLQRFLELSPDHPEAEAARQMLAGL